MMYELVPTLYIIRDRMPEIRLMVDSYESNL